MHKVFTDHVCGVGGTIKLNLFISIKVNTKVIC